MDTTSFSPPLFSSYNDKIRPIIDTIDKLRSLKVMEQGVPHLTIIVAGENYSGKASLIESLVGIFPPNKVPLIMRFQNHPNPAPELVLKYQKKCVPIMNERLISKAINEAILEIGRVGKSTPNVPLTLVVKKKGVPDLTMIYLPGKYWCSMFQDKSRDIFQHISDMSKEVIKETESIILNVSSMQSRLPSAINPDLGMERRRKAERILAVITKCDLQPLPFDVCKAISENKFKVRTRCHFIRNRIDGETHKQARIGETRLFETCSDLSKIEKSMVGIPALATRIVKKHIVIIMRLLPDIVKKINEGIHGLESELKQLPGDNPLSIPDALIAFMHMVGSLKETLENVLIKGKYDDFDYIEDKQMHCNARLAEMLDEFSKKLNSDSIVKFSENFMVEELDVLKEANGIWSPLSVPRFAVLCLLDRKLMSITTFPIEFAKKAWDYLEIVCVRLLIDRHGEYYPQLVSSMRKAIQDVMERMKVEFLERVLEMIEMEKTTDYTCDSDFVASCNKLIMCNRDEFWKAMHNHLEEINMQCSSSSTTSTTTTTTTACNSIVDHHHHHHHHEQMMMMINVKHLLCVPENKRDQAFDLKMRMSCYWEIVVKRMVDWMALELPFMIQKLVNKEMETEIVKEVMVHGSGIEKMSEELSSTGKERVRLQRSIVLFHKSIQIIDGIRMALISCQYTSI